MTDLDLKRQLDEVNQLGINAPRPQRQHAYLHYGGWGFHANICAEDVVAALFLHSSLSLPTLPSVEWMFPDSSEDPTYDALITLKGEVIENGFKMGYEHIVEYRQPKPSNSE